MKNKINRLAAICSISAVFAMGCFTQAGAQTTTPPSATDTFSFLSSVQTYFTSFNTNLTMFQTERGELWTAIDQNPNNLAAILGITYDLGKSWNAEAVMRNASVAGTIVSAQVGPSYAIVHFDTKLAVGVDGGCRFDNGNVAFAEFYLDARKALTANTFAGVRLYYDQEFSGNNTAAHSPGVMIITGFKF